MTLCAVYDSEELLRILPTVAEARLKLTPKADPETNDMRGVTLDPQIEQLTRGLGELISAINQRHVFLLRVTDNIRTATEERFRSIEGEKMAELNQRISDLAAFFDGWTSGMEQRCKDIEREQTAMQREIEELR
jgi:wobble nucleotide-excising tRNase